MKAKDWTVIYRQRADEARSIASMMYSEDHRTKMILLAEAYEKMALEAEQEDEPAIVVTIDSDTKYRQ